MQWVPCKVSYFAHNPLRSYFHEHPKNVIYSPIINKMQQGNSILLQGFSKYYFAADTDRSKFYMRLHETCSCIHDTGICNHTFSHNDVFYRFSMEKILSC